jgi:UDP-N-acetylglucosamine 2-epimerase (non-hydrolysing)
MVMGDVNTTVAAALVASRKGLPVVHLEAGLRSHNWDPEEINRKVITSCSSYHLAPSRYAVRNLMEEGVKENSIFLVGNSMAEAFIHHAEVRRESSILTELGLNPREYVLFTAHKSANLTNFNWLNTLLEVLSTEAHVVFPCHPHTRRLLAKNPLPTTVLDNLVLLDPLSYADFGRLLECSRLVITDSAGAQEESTVAGVPCITIGYETARPETIYEGTNTLVGYDLKLCTELVQNPHCSRTVPEYWDTDVSKRISKAMDYILEDIGASNQYGRWKTRF